MKLTGYPVSPGIARGRCRLIRAQEVSVLRRHIDAGLVEQEVQRLLDALAGTAQQIRLQKEQAKERLSEDFLDIFDAHVAILQDPALSHGAISRMRREFVNAEFALQGAVKDMVHGLLSTGDSYFQERASDLEDLHRKVQAQLAGNVPAETFWVGRELVLLADTLSLSDASAMHHDSLKAFATEHGGRTSHTAILARSLEIPAVVGVHGLLEEASADSEVIVDGLEGAVVLDPTEEEKLEYERKAKAWKERQEKMLLAAREDSSTLDGHRILLHANVDLLSEIDACTRFGADGVGLYRSEFLFLEKAPHIPSEADHFECYDRLAKAFYPHRVVVRTLDLGGEKYFHGVLDKGEPNPVLGLRAIRFCLKRPDILMPQLRGILKASARKNVSVMFPFVTILEELLDARAMLEKAKEGLRAEGAPFDEDLPVGIMVEVPSCALCAEAFAPHVDFMSIGTNDLIQYLMAVDRNNESVASLHDPLHPSVLRCIGHVCDVAAAAGKAVTVCGEAAADPRIIPLLVGLGVTELSMTPTVLLDAKEVIRNLSYNRCHRLARHALKATSGAAVAGMLESLPKGRAPRK